MDYITLAIAMVGAVLGIINTTYTINQHRVRLRVKAVMAITPTEIYHGIEVTNLSAFSVEVSEVGYLRRRSINNKTPARLLLTRPNVFDGKPFPRRLGPREQVSLYIEEASRPGGELWGVYARTVCGELAKGKISRSS